ncbi:MAG TPA: AAA family ATPase [Frankiaceae bacterium]|nr:AAA family ATPase [Frankiaceae bacterium]
MPLVERDAELASLRAHLRTLRDSGTGAVVLVEGPAGIGKSALVDEALREAEGVSVLRTRGAELEGTLSFGAVRELFAAAVMRLPKEERDGLFDGPAGLARPVLGFDGDRTGDPLYGLFWLAVGLSDRSPLVVVVDDLHWLDEESSRFVGYLARRLEGLPILLLASARPAEPGTDPGAVAELAGLAEVVRPRPLSAEGVAALVSARDPATVHRATGGNPLLVLEVARAGADLDVERVAPANVGRGILRRVARVSDDAVALSRAIALSSEPPTPAEAAAVAGIDEVSAGRCADALIAAEILVFAGGRLSFAHPLMRTAVYEEIPPLERRRAHSDAARLLAERGADVEVVAAHLLHGEPEGDAAAVRLLRDAADRALSRAAPRAAVRYLQRALEEPPRADARAAMRYELGCLQARLGRPDAIATLRAAYAEARSDALRADVAVSLADAYVEAERHDEAVALLDDVQSSPGLDAQRRLELDAVRVMAMTEQGAVIDELLRVVERMPCDLEGRTPAERRALTVQAYVRRVGGAPVAEVQELLARANGSEDAELSPIALWHMRMTSMTDTPEAAAAIASNLLDRARSTGAEMVYAAAQLQLAISANQLGDLPACEAALRLGLVSPGLTPQYRVALEDWLVTTLSMQGRFAEAEQLLMTLSGREDNYATRLLDRRRLELALDRGDYAAAIEPAERAYELLGGRLHAGAGLSSDYAIALAGVGRLKEAEEVARATLEAAERSGYPQETGLALTALGIALRGDEAIATLERAVEVLGASPYRWNLANAEVALGAALRRAGRRADARPPLLSALEYAARNGAVPIETRAREELRLAGARPRRVERTGVDALTPSEDRIARLAASGMSNRRIAQHLFLTVRTVEMHLGSAYRKLAVSSRGELPGVYATAARPDDRERAAALTGSE